MSEGPRPTTLAHLWETLLPLGRDAATGGYRRYSWTAADTACREWFRRAAGERGLRCHTDNNGNLWAWWDPPSAPGPAAPAAVVTGSHLDSVPDGGAFDGPLGVATGFAAVDMLRRHGRVPVRPLGVAAFCEEEGARFGVACLGSRLLTGAISPDAARALRDGSGITLAEAMAAAGCDPAGIGPDGDLLASIGAYVELHVEQGRFLADRGAAIGVADGIWPHGRWRLAFSGRPDHAGTALLPGRRDPLLPAAVAVMTARRAAAKHGGLATIGKMITEPGAVNAVPAAVTAWLDARAPAEPVLAAIVSEVLAAAREAAAEHGVILDTEQESATAAVVFDPSLRDTVLTALSARGVTAPVMPTGAGHDAGILAARVPAAMLFVRNPSGVSHSPAEQAEWRDCEAGVAALAAVLEDLACAAAVRGSDGQDTA